MQIDYLLYIETIVCEYLINMNILKLYSFTCRLLSFKVNSFNRHFVSRTKSFYDVLGITPKATASDIKTAYYKLSMTFHPDKNKSDDSAAEKFRNVTEAYEVLGNYRLRKLYDKGKVTGSSKKCTI